MKTFYLFFFCLLVAFSGCRQSTINPGSGNAEPDYFPLQVGNEWVYENNPYDSVIITYKVVGKINLSGTEYYQVLMYNNQPTDEITKLMRCSEGKVYLYVETKDELLYDFTGTDTSYKHWHKVSFNNEVVIPSGKFSDCIIISPQDGIDGGMTYKFAPNIGLIEQGAIYPSTLVLKHATINGKVLF